jgi:hypothetical protein
MDGHGFDSLVKALGSDANRRRVLRGLLGSSVAGAAVVSRTFEAQAAKSCGPFGSPCPRKALCVNGKCGGRCPSTSSPCLGTRGGECCTQAADCCICRDTASGESYGACFGAQGTCAGFIFEGATCSSAPA